MKCIRFPVSGDDAGTLARSVSREESFGVVDAQMLVRDLDEDIAEVGRHVEIALFEQFALLEARPLSGNTAAAHRAAQNQHRASRSVIGSFRSILGDGPSELAGHYDHHAIVELPEVAMESSQRLPEIREVRFVAGKLIRVRIELRFEVDEDAAGADAGLDDL